MGGTAGGEAAIRDCRRKNVNTKEAFISFAKDARNAERRLREKAAKCNKTAAGICRKRRLLAEATRLAAEAMRFEMKARLG